MSQENVELVRRLQPGPDVDIAQLFRDDTLWAELVEALRPLYHRDFECTLPVFGAARPYAGLEGLRAAWLDWLAPWATYRTEVDDLIDFGARVLILVRDYGRREPGGPEVAQTDAAIWTVRDAKIARAEFYADRSEALKAVGPEE